MRSTINGLTFFYQVRKPYTEHAVDPKGQASGIDAVPTLPHNPTTSA